MPPLLVRHRVGRESAVYQLPEETMVTRPTSALLLLSLESESRGPVERGAFVQRMLRLALKSSDSGKPLTGEGIEEEIDYCRDRGLPYIQADNKGFIQVTDRVFRERTFLEMIAVQAGEHIEPDFEIVFESSFSPEDVSGVLTALADYYRSCGGAGFELNLGLEEAPTMEPAYE
jgi:hypothetical protein